MPKSTSVDVQARFLSALLQEREVQPRAFLLAQHNQETAKLDALKLSFGSGLTEARRDFIADVLRQGGRIKPRALAALVKKHGYKPQTVGLLHGRRLAHLRRDPRTRESVLTARGEEVAKQYLFAERLARGARESLES
jgi:hypothetical protein